MDTMQIEVSFQKKLDGLFKVESFRDNCQCKLFSRLVNPFGNFDEPFERVSKPFARLC